MRQPLSTPVRARWRIALGVGVATLIHATVAPATEGEDRWRLYESDDKALLAITDTDQGTDALGSPYFTCSLGSGSIEVVSVLDDEKRLAVAEVIREGKYPTIDLGAGSDNSVISEVRHSDMDGWLLIFQMSAISKAFDRFRASGALEFRVGKASFQVSFDVGLDQIAKFQNVCRQTPR